jgi:hypothetical protein
MTNIYVCLHTLRITLFPDFYTSQQQVSSVVWQLYKVAPYFTSVLIYFSGPSESLMPALLSVENRVPLKPVLENVRVVALIQYPL